MLTPPHGLSDATLLEALREHWGLAVVSIEYRPVGWGSHHWTALEQTGVRWFVTVDDLDTKRHQKTEPAQTAFARLSAALGTASHLSAAGLGFVVAPIPTRTADSLVPLARQFAAALYPFVEGESFTWGSPQPRSRQRELIDIILKLHAVSASRTPDVLEEDFMIPQRDSFNEAFELVAASELNGPYTSRTRAILARNQSRLNQLVARYEGLVVDVAENPPRRVLTHGEPHVGNTMLTSGGLMLVDWDTVLLAPPERDLWILEKGDGDVLSEYAEATGRSPDRSLLELYSIRWDLADLTAYVSRFLSPHLGTAEDEESWRQLQSLIDRLIRS